MAIFHLSAKIVSRSKRQNAVAKAAYNARTKLRDEQPPKIPNAHRVKKIKDYSRLADKLVFSGIFAPKEHPSALEWLRWEEGRRPEQLNAIRGRLWNAVERGENRKDSQLARELVVSLPYELRNEQRKWLITDFVNEQFVRRGMIADVNIHPPGGEGDRRNYHAHILLTMRKITPEGFGPKARKWNSPLLMEKWRKAWEKLLNDGLERFSPGVPKVDRRSLKARGIDRDPQRYMGPVVTAQIRKKTKEEEREELETSFKTEKSSLAKPSAKKARAKKEQPGAVARPDYIARTVFWGEKGREAGDYSRPVGNPFIFAPECAPAWVRDWSRLSKALEQSSKRKGSEFAQEIVVALPRQLNDEQRKLLVTDFTREQFQRKKRNKITAVVNIPPSGGKEDDGGCYARIMLIMREITPEGFGSKVEEWNNPQTTEKWYVAWEHLRNRYLARLSPDAPKVVRSSPVEQGVGREPLRSVGPSVAVRGPEKTKQEETQEPRKAFAIVKIKTTKPAAKKASKISRLKGQFVEAAREIVKRITPYMWLPTSKKSAPQKPTISLHPKSGRKGSSRRAPK